jgi:hypothetical protein
LGPVLERFRPFEPLAVLWDANTVNEAVGKDLHVCANPIGTTLTSDSSSDSAFQLCTSTSAPSTSASTVKAFKDTFSPPTYKLTTAQRGMPLTVRALQSSQRPKGA